MNGFQAQIQEILQFKKNVSEATRLPSGCAFLSDDIILAYPQEKGNARYPYSADGMTVWAHSSGDISASESRFTILPDTTEGEEARCAFFVGEKEGAGYRPVSVTGVAVSGMESGVERFTVFTPRAAYYFAVKEELLSVVRVFVDVKKRIFFSFYLKNTSNAERELYQAAYFNPLLQHAEHGDMGSKWHRFCTATEEGYLLRATDYLSRTEILRNFCALSSSARGAFKTTSRSVFNGGMNRSLASSVPLFAGKFAEKKLHTEFTETAAAGEILPLTLAAGGEHTVHYCMSYSGDRARAERSLPRGEAVEEIFETQASVTGGERAFELRGLSGKFAPYEEVISPFLNSVLRQTEFCAQAKNYVGVMIGIRDIFQQVEGAIPFLPEACRKKIIEALGYVGEDGRAPRQYSYPSKPGIPPEMDLREYIDQGVWIVSTVYTYLCYTADFSLLDEICGYYRFEENKVLLSGKRDSVLCHLLAIADYLLSNLDEETHCLHALYGDWNDALDGLGDTADRNRRFGNGVSVMATLQLYCNLGELKEILERVGGHAARVAEFARRREEIAAGLTKYAVIERRNGSHKILHGWGEDRDWFVGSDCDSDGLARDGLTSNAFWVLSGMEERAPLHGDIVAAYGRLKGKYGIKTFEPYFAESNDKVGRINRLPKGTAENAATYIHATLFGIRSLFRLGETARAWEELYKIFPFTHEKISTSPFVMPNSYIENAEKGLDGESMSDWFTGSGCVLVKALCGEVFGVKPDLNGVTISPAGDPPFASGECRLLVKGKTLRVKLVSGRGRREITCNGKAHAGNSLYLPAEELAACNEIEVSLP